jgi:antitoxin component of MazEF toxin-antitoxin module
MGRDIVKVRKVGGTLVVTLTQAVLEQIGFSEGDRVLVEAVPPRRIIISKEESKMPNTRRIELEIQALEAKQKAIESDIEYKIFQDNKSMPVDEGMNDPSVAELILHGLNHERDTVAASIAEKRLELFELQGA